MDSANSLHPFLASNSDHAMNHLGDYNCSVRTYAHTNHARQIAVVTSQMIHHMV